MGIREKAFASALLAAIALAWTGSGASALVIPGTPEYEMREHKTYEVPSYYREVRISYHSSERESAHGAREIRLAYPRQRGRSRRDGSLIEQARSARVAESKSAGNDANASSSTARATVNYRNSTQYQGRRQGRVSLRIPGRDDSEARRPRAIHGVASWYGWDFQGRKTANGETYNMYDMTAAHRTLPFGTMVRVTNLRNGRQRIVRINDRGPFIAGREIDLSYATARDLGMLDTGIEKVLMEIL